MSQWSSVYGQWSCSWWPGSEGWLMRSSQLLEPRWTPWEEISIEYFLCPFFELLSTLFAVIRLFVSKKEITWPNFDTQTSLGKLQAITFLRSRVNYASLKFCLIQIEILDLLTKLNGEKIIFISTQWLVLPYLLLFAILKSLI